MTWRRRGYFPTPAVQTFIESCVSFRVLKLVILCNLMLFAATCLLSMRSLAQKHQLPGVLPQCIWCGSQAGAVLRGLRGGDMVGGGSTQAGCHTLCDCRQEEPCLRSLVFAPMA